MHLHLRILIDLHIYTVYILSIAYVSIFFFKCMHIFNRNIKLLKSQISKGRNTYTHISIFFFLISKNSKGISSFSFGGFSRKKNK